MLLTPPDDDEERLSLLESAITTELAAALGQQKDYLLEGLPDDAAPDRVAAQIVHRAPTMPTERARDVLARRLAESASLGVTGAVTGLDGLGFSFNWQLPHRGAMAWAEEYSFPLVAQINQTSARLTGFYLSRWASEPTPLWKLEQDLAGVFGESRARRIAVTETTRVYAEGARRTYVHSGVVSGIQWLTSNDERVCPICRPLNEQQGSLGNGLPGVGLPPAHVNCRCRIAGVVGELPSMALPQLEPPPIEDAGGLDADGFPTNFRRLERVRSLGGSTGAYLVRDPFDGGLYVVKYGSSPAHLQEEMEADRLYRALGVNVPDFRSYETDRGAAKVARFVEGTPLSDYRGDSKAWAKVKKEVQKGFMADALMGNWDVVGMNYDNILIDKRGRAWRIDNGGSLRRRAQGGEKEYGRWFDEVWTLRNARMNRQAADVFGDLEYKEIVKQMRSLTKQGETALAAAPPELQPLLRARLETLTKLSDIGHAMGRDGWRYEYLDEFSRHYVGMGRAGIVDRMPQQFTNRGVFVYDEKGKLFDSLRGQDSVMGDFERYLRGNGGNPEPLQLWMAKQGSDSWNEDPQALKWFIANQRTDSPATAFWWKHGPEKAQSYYDELTGKWGKPTYNTTFTAWHALNYALLDKVDMPHKKGNQITLMRTENRWVMRHYGHNPGDKGVTMPRGPAESTSIFRRVRVHGTESTTQRMHIGRVVGSYFFERIAGSGSSGFMGDNENELIAVLDGVKFNYNAR